MTRLVQAEEQGDTLSETEMLNMLRLLLVAGNETTTNLIGNGMLALLRHPDQLQALRDNPGLIPAAVDELLRYDSPVQMTLRCAVEDCDINGTSLRAGQDVILLGGSANRDPDAFENPDQLDFNRKKPDHISFGRGIPLLPWRGPGKSRRTYRFRDAAGTVCFTEPAYGASGVSLQHSTARS